VRRYGVISAGAVHQRSDPFEPGIANAELREMIYRPPEIVRRTPDIARSAYGTHVDDDSEPTGE
jgi:hypothetical protein